MKKNRGMIIFGIIVVLSLIMTACQPKATEAPAAEEPVSQETAVTVSEDTAATEAAPAVEAAKPTQIIYAIGAEPETLFPGYESTALASYGFELVFNNLTTKDLEGNNIGDLAETWEVSEDQLTWTFHLVKNAKWHDGEPFTAKDVRYTFELLADPAYTGTYYTMIESIAGAAEKHDGAAETISGISIVDDYTISITTKEPNALALDTMAGVMPILPEHVLSSIPVTDLANSDFARAPIGTGPYKLREWKAEESLIFDKNPEYWGGNVNIGTFIWQIIPEASAQITALLNGEVDLISVNADDYSQVQNVDGIATKETPGSRYYMINFHHTDPLLADVRTRKALAHALDREGLLQGVFGGQGAVENCIFHPSLSEYDETLTGYEYNVDLAKQMLAEVGWTDGDGDGILEAHGVEGVEDGTKFTIEIGSVSSTIYVRYNEMIQQYLKAIGIETNINSMETGIYYGEYFLMGGPWQIVGSGWANLIGSPQQELLWNITCDSNSQYDYCNKDLDALIYKNNTYFDNNERMTNFSKILKIMEEEAIYLPTMRPKDLYAYDASLVPANYQSTMDLYRSIPVWSYQ